MLEVDHGERGATMTVVGEITNDLVVELVEHVSKLGNTFSAAEVELKIASPGGSAHALNYFIEAMAGFHALRTRLTTRALTHAASAAAVLVSLGDRRLASRASLLRYHAGRFRVERAEVTADRASGMKDILDNVDERLIGLLVQRARRRPETREPVTLEPGRAALGDFHDRDWPTIARLAGAAGARQRRTPKDLLARLRKRVVTALNSRRAQSLTTLYTELFALDTPISAALALELHLIDELVPATGVPETPPELDPQSVFRVPEWHALYPAGRIDRAALCRHTLILGESGSGKTVSGVRPVVHALFDDDNRVGCALVIDPKRDFEALLTRLATDGTPVRTLAVGDGTWIVNLMSGAHSLEDDLERDRVLTAAKKILVRAASLVPQHAARSLTGSAPNRSHDPYWEQEGARMAQAALAITLLVLHRLDRLFGPLMRVSLGAPQSTARIALAEFARRAGLVVPDRQIERAVKRTRKTLAENNDSTPPEVVRTRFARRVRESHLYRDRTNCFASDFDALRAACPEPADPGEFDRATRELLEQVLLVSCRPPEGTVHGVLQPEPANVLALAGVAAELMFTWPGEEEGLARPSLAATPVVELLQGLVGGRELDELGTWVKSWQVIASGQHRGHYNGIHGHVGACFRDFADPAPAATLFFGCEPFYRAVADGDSRATEIVDFSKAVDDPEGRHLYVMHPELGGGPDTLIARALKASYFEAVLYSEQRRRRGRDMPLVAYVSDEFHRYVTSDRTHGEQSFVDTCRSFGAFCVFACQSVASLRHALAQDGGDWESDRAAVAMLLTNTASKFFFRSTDPETRDYLERLTPGTAAGHGVKAARPLATLQPGECYAVTAEGRFRMQRLDPHVLPPAKPDGAGAAPEPDEPAGPSQQATGDGVDEDPPRFR